MKSPLLFMYALQGARNEKDRGNAAVFCMCELCFPATQSVGKEEGRLVIYATGKQSCSNHCFESLILFGS